VDVIVEFNEAAFRHGISREDILCALKTKIRAGNPIELIYNPVNDNTISVFHAMKARKSFIKMLGL